MMLLTILNDLNDEIVIDNLILIWLCPVQFLTLFSLSQISLAVMGHGWQLAPLVNENDWSAGQR
jgi:hypothetical protein